MIGGLLAIVAFVVFLVLSVGRHGVLQKVGPSPTPPTPPVIAPATGTPAHPSLLYGRVSTKDGSTYEGRLRFGGDQEAFWEDYFNGAKGANPWVPLVPPQQLPMERHVVTVLGIELGRREQPRDMGRQFMTRFGDIARIEASGTDVRVTLKSGTTFDLRRMDASDFDDGLRVWDGKGGVVDLDSMRIHTIDFLPAAPMGSPPDRLHGTVHTQGGDFTGFLQWNRTESLGSDELQGRARDGNRSLRFDAIQSIARQSSQSCLVTLRDGGEVELSGSSAAGEDNLGVYVNDPRYGRVLVSWDAFQRVDFSPGGGSPAYADFPKGVPLRGSVTTTAGQRLAGRLVYDLDESETTETLDAPADGVDYTIPFGLVASVVLPGREAGHQARARVTLQDGEELQLQRGGDLGKQNAGLLVFAEGGARPAYVAWAEVQRVDFDRPPATYPPLGAR